LVLVRHFVENNLYICSRKIIISSKKVQTMNEKLRKLLSDKCKDMGLTDKALDELATLGSEGLGDDVTDDDITKKADSLAMYGKAMQAEITRKTRSKSKTTIKQPSSDDDEDGGEGENAALNALIAKQLAPLSEQLNALKSENDALKAEKAKSERSALIADKATKLGLPDYLVKRLNFDEEADIDKELADIKQEMVSHNLMPKDAALETGAKEDAMKADAKSWAESLPNK